jgi:hypothetical protein
MLKAMTRLNRTLAPCLNEQWFIDDTINGMEGLCPLCVKDLEYWLRFFGPDNRTALSEIYRQSRAIRIGRVRDSMFDSARETGPWEAVHVMQFISFGIGKAITAYSPCRPPQSASEPVVF